MSAAHFSLSYTPRCSSGFRKRNGKAVREDLDLIKLLYVVKGLFGFLLSVLELFLLARALLSWLPFEEDHPLVVFIDVVTEPFIAPVRMLLERFNLFQGFPIDMAHFITLFLVSIVSVIL